MEYKNKFNLHITITRTIAADMPVVALATSGRYQLAVRYLGQ